MYPVMLAALEAKNFGRARNICDQAIMWEPQNPVHHYNLACIEAQAGGPRLPYAWGALELSIALGFNDAGHLQRDPDLAPLRRDSKFADLVRKVIYNTTAGAATSSLNLPAPSTTPPAAPPEAELSATAVFQDDLPVGLFSMTRYLSSAPAVENSVWYFADDRTVYRGLQDGFSKADLATHTGPRGVVRRQGRSLEIEWSDGTKSTAELERDGTGFTWDMGIFTPIISVENANELAGVYEGSETVALGSAGMPVAERIELREDGTFSWTGVSFSEKKSGSVRIVRRSSEVSSGHWQMRGFSLVLTTPGGLALRRLAFPQDEEKTVIRPDRLYLGGVIYRRRP
jgi:hypothetical protein